MRLTTALVRFPGPGGWTFALVPAKHAPPVTEGGTVTVELSPPGPRQKGTRTDAARPARPRPAKRTR